MIEIKTARVHPSLTPLNLDQDALERGLGSMSGIYRSHALARGICDLHREMKPGGTVMKLRINLLMVGTLLMVALLLGGCVLTGPDYWTPRGYTSRGTYYRGSSPYYQPYRRPQSQPHDSPQIGPGYRSQPYYYRPYYNAPH
jgi:hypothetical protein